MSVVRARHAADDSPSVKARSLVAAFATFARTLRGADVVGGRVHPAVFLPIVAAKLTGRTTFLFLQGRPSDMPSASLPFRLLARVSAVSFRIAMMNSHVIFATSPGLATWARKVSKARVQLVTNGVDVTRFDWPVADRRGAVFVGTPAPWQGLDTLVEATRLAEWPRDLVLTVIGADEPDFPQLTGGNIQFLGRLAPSDVARELSRHQIGVSPKRLDAATEMGVSPFKLAEYHGAGLAVVASDVPGQRDMIAASRGGCLVPPGDARALALAIRNLQSDPARMTSKQANARAYAERALTWRAQRKVVIDAIAAVVQQRQGLA